MTSKPLPVPMVLDDRAAWFEEAYLALDALISRGRRFSSDDFRDLVPVPSQPNWVGAAFQAYQRLGYIRPAGFILSRSKSRRNGVTREWVANETRS